MQQPELGTLVGRALRLKCPRCGGGAMFAGMFRMHERCGHCGLKYEREPGYYLGSIYINYGITALLTTAGYILLHFIYGFDTRQLMIGFAAFCVLFPTLFFRHARALWLAFDCHFDSSAFEDDA